MELTSRISGFFVIHGNFIAWLFRDRPIYLIHYFLIVNHKTIKDNKIIFGCNLVGIMEVLFAVVKSCQYELNLISIEPECSTDFSECASAYAGAIIVSMTFKKSLFLPKCRRNLTPCIKMSLHK